MQRIIKTNVNSSNVNIGRELTPLLGKLGNVTTLSAGKSITGRRIDTEKKLGRTSRQSGPPFARKLKKEQRLPD